MTGDERIKLANNILNILGYKSKLIKLEDINCKLFLLFYQSLFGDKLEGVNSSLSEKDDYLNISLIIEALSKNILHVSLSHINPGDIVEGNEVAVTNLLEIFQGLAECMLKSENQMDDNNQKSDRQNIFDKRTFRVKVDRVKQIEKEIDQSAVDMKYCQLKKSIHNTERQADNLAMLVNQSLCMGSSRQRYLHGKIVELLSKSTNTSPGSSSNERLRDYVNDHKDHLVLMQANMLNKSTSNNNRQHNTKHNTECNQVGLEDDLTCITTNEYTGDRESIDSVDLSHASNETYVLESSGRPNECSPTFNEDLKVKNAWVQVNKDLINQGYEQDFLNMLLDEGEMLNDKKDKCHSRGQILRDFSQAASTTRPLSAFDELLKSDEDNTEEHQLTESARRYSKTNNSKTPNRGGFVKPVVKHIGGQRVRELTNKETQALNSPNSDIYTSSADQMIITKLLDTFPGLQINDHTLRHLWTQAAQQAASIQRSQHNFVSKLSPGEQRVEDARQRQKLLSLMLRKEALHQIRLQERQEERTIQIAAQAAKERQRQQSARAKRYLDEFSNGMKARMINKQAKEEQVFRNMFKAALKIQRDRVIEIRKYARDVKNQQLYFHQRDLDSLENYYRDRFSMLAESLQKERKEIKLQDKSQELALLKLKKNMRCKMEHDIRMIQDSMIDSQHEIYFRELDAKRTLSGMTKN